MLYPPLYALKWGLGWRVPLSICLLRWSSSYKSLNCCRFLHQVVAVSTCTRTFCCLFWFGLVFLLHVLIDGGPQTKTIPGEKESRCFRGCTRCSRKGSGCSVLKHTHTHRLRTRGGKDRWLGRDRRRGKSRNNFQMTKQKIGMHGYNSCAIIFSSTNRPS